MDGIDYSRGQKSPKSYRGVRSDFSVHNVYICRGLCNARKSNLFVCDEILLQTTRLSPSVVSICIISRRTVSYVIFESIMLGSFYVGARKFNAIWCVWYLIVGCGNLSVCMCVVHYFDVN